MVTALPSWLASAVFEESCQIGFCFLIFRKGPCGPHFSLASFGHPPTTNFATVFPIAANSYGHDCGQVGDIKAKVKWKYKFPSLLIPHFFPKASLFSVLNGAPPIQVQF